MTLVLKELKDLKGHLTATIRILWHKHIEEKEIPKNTPEEELINQLHEVRRNELLYLWGVITELEARIEKDKPETAKPYVDIYYGAIYTTIKHIEEKLYFWEDDGLLKERLEMALRNDTKEVIDTNTPDNYQFIDFYSSLNAFLKLIFKENDSRNGLTPSRDLAPNTLSKIPPEQLAEFVHFSYQFEEEAQNAIHARYLGDGATVANSDNYRAPKDTPLSAVGQFTSYQNLKDDLDELIRKELGKKGVREISKLADPNRIRQLDTLEAVAKKLESTQSSAISESEKIAILAGFMLMVREDIGHNEYKKAPFNPELLSSSIPFTVPPVLHTGLTKILKMKDMKHEDAEALITAAKNFMVFMTVEQDDSDSEIKECTRTNHLFSKITGFSVSNVLSFLQTLIKSARSDALNHCVEKYKQELEASLPQKKSYISLPSVSGWFAKKTQTPPTSERSASFDKADSSTTEVTVSKDSTSTLLALDDNDDILATNDGNVESKEPTSTLTNMNF